MPYYNRMTLFSAKKEWSSFKFVIWFSALKLLKENVNLWTAKMRDEYDKFLHRTILLGMPRKTFEKLSQIIDFETDHIFRRSKRIWKTEQNKKWFHCWKFDRMIETEKLAVIGRLRGFLINLNWKNTLV